MKKTLILSLISILIVNFSYGHGSAGKFAKWQIQSYFRGYNVLYETPKTQQDFIDFKNYGGNLFHIQPDGFFNTDPPYNLVQANIDGTDMLVNFCRVAGIHYVIGVRSGPGAYDTFDESGGTSPESRIWNTGNTAEQQKYAEMLQMIVQLYANDTLFVGINLVIEPRPKVKVIPANTSQLYKLFLERVYNIHMDQVYTFWVSKIREVDPEIPVILENFAYSTPELFPAYIINDPFIIYSAHDYQPNEFTKAETPFSMAYPGTYWNITFLAQKLYNEQFIRETIFGKLRDFGLSTGAPVFIGEFGMYKPQIGGANYLNDVLNVCLDNGWHFALWDWRRGGGESWNIEGFLDTGNVHWKTVLSKFNAPPVPNLLYPVNGEFAFPYPTFIWDSLTAFTSYDLMIEPPNGEQPIIIEDITNARYTYTDGLLKKGVTISWKLRSKNPGGNPENWSEWSDAETFYIPVPDTPDKNKEREKNVFSLKQNSPNPFNPSTNISYSIPKNSYVKLVVYDIIGREVASLVNRELKQGSYSALFYAQNLPSGVYICRFEAVPINGSTGFTEIKRMVLIK